MHQVDHQQYCRHTYCGGIDEEGNIAETIDNDAGEAADNLTRQRHERAEQCILSRGVRLIGETRQICDEYGVRESCADVALARDPDRRRHGRLAHA